MPISYQQYYKIIELMSAQIKLRATPEVYNFDSEKMLAAALERLARPLPNGQESPFSSRSAGSMHYILIEQLIGFQQLLAHEFNIIPDRIIADELRLRGFQQKPAEYATLKLTFTRTAAARRDNIDVIIPFRTEVASEVEPTLKAIVISEAVITGNADSVTVKARLNRRGQVTDVRPNEFTKSPPIPYLSSVTNREGCDYEGKDTESLSSTFYRSVVETRVQGNCSSPRQFIEYATAVLKVPTAIAVRERNWITVAIYPDSLIESVKPALLEVSPGESMVRVRGANLIPIDGLIEVSALPNLSESQATNLVIDAIVDNLNPPHGIWGDYQLPTTLVQVLLKINGIFAVPTVQLKHVETNTPYEDLEKQPWDLFVFHDSIEINILR